MLRPFVLEEALKIQRGEKQGRIVARSGNHVRIICSDAKSSKYPVIGLEDTGTTRGEIMHSYTIDGANYCFGQMDSDLFIEEEIAVIPYDNYCPEPYEPVLYRYRFDDSSTWNVGVFCEGCDDTEYIRAGAQTIYTLENYIIIPFNEKTNYLFMTNMKFNDK